MGYKDRKFIVYMHISPNGKKYVGITHRKPQYRFNSGKNYKYNVHFYNAIMKYGWDNFEHHILYKDLSFDEACEIEKQLIKKYNLTNPNYGYNKTTGGEGTPGFTLSEDQKDALSKRVKALHNTGWCPMRGRHNPHFRDENGNVDKSKTKPIRDYAIKNNYVSRLSRHVEECKRPVNQYDLSGDFIASFESITKAAESVGANKTNIQQVCSRKKTNNGSTHKTCKGFQWRYADDCDDIVQVNDLTAKRIAQFDKSGNIISTFNSCTDAMKNTNIHKASISACVHGKQKSAGGYIWKYA